MFRIALGSLVAADAALRARDLVAHYTDAGYLPRGEALAELNHGWIVSLHAVSGGAAWQAILFALTIVAGIALALGWRTRTATVAAWILVTSAQVRFPLGNSAADTLLRLALFWSMFLPLGARMALDRRRVGGISIDALVPPSRVSGLPIAALFAQVAIVYFVSGVMKSGREWVDGVAIQYILGIEPYSTSLGVNLQSQPLLLRRVTAGVRYLELVGPFLLFSPWRTALVRSIAIAGFAAFQLGLLFTMRLGFFPLVSLIVLLPLVPPAIWDRILGASSERETRRASLFARAAVALALVYVALWNVASVMKLDLGRAREPGYALKLAQGWSVFAPDLPVDLDGWWTAPAGQPEPEGRGWGSRGEAPGNQIDLFRACFAGEVGPPSLVKPPDARGWRIVRHRWARALMQARLYEEDRLLLARWLCRCGGVSTRFARSTRTGEHVRLVFVQEEAVLNREPAASAVDLGSFDCP